MNNKRLIDSRLKRVENALSSVLRLIDASKSSYWRSAAWRIDRARDELRMIRTQSED